MKGVPGTASEGHKAGAGACGGSLSGGAGPSREFWKSGDEPQKGPRGTLQREKKDKEAGLPLPEAKRPALPIEENAAGRSEAWML